MSNRDTKIKSILVTQPKPDTEKSPYGELLKKYNVKLDFRSFIEVQGVEAKEFRKEKISVLEHTAVILNSRNAADHFFRLCSEMRITIPETMKYFCLSEAVALYLQKHVTYRKRKIFFGKQKFSDLMEVIAKHKQEKYLFPYSGDLSKDEASELLEKHKIEYTKVVMYKTICSDLSDLASIKYDMIVFFSPSAVRSLYQNFPDFKQNNTRIAAFGATTCQAIKDAGLELDVFAPHPQAPSMAMAIEQYVRQVNK